jgi:SAM-dependent methyltransferase
MKEFWNQRYSDQAYAYGTKPNVFFKSQIDKLSAGKILLPAEGEGRNAVYAATKGWEVKAYDISDAGQQKALQLANEKQVSIDYQVGALDTLNYEEESFDAIGLIYAHFPPGIRTKEHQALIRLLKPGGHIILEAFHKKQIEFNSKNPKAGGPKHVDLLYNIEEMKFEFKNFEFLQLEETIVTLEEGLFHLGDSAVLRMLARK